MTDRRPPRGVQKAAQRAVRWIEDGEAGSNFTDVGRKRARQLADGDTVSDQVVRKMDQYFSRHEGDKDGNGFKRGGEGYPSAGRVAWDAWGGDPGQRWARSQVAKLDD